MLFRSVCTFIKNNGLECLDVSGTVCSGLKHDNSSSMAKHHTTRFISAFTIDILVKVELTVGGAGELVYTV